MAGIWTDQHVAHPARVATKGLAAALGPVDIDRRCLSGAEWRCESHVVLVCYTTPASAPDLDGLVAAAIVRTIRPPPIQALPRTVKPPLPKLLIHLVMSLAQPPAQPRAAAHIRRVRPHIRPKVVCAPRTRIQQRERPKEVEHVALRRRRGFDRVIRRGGM